MSYATAWAASYLYVVIDVGTAIKSIQDQRIRPQKQPKNWVYLILTQKLLQVKFYSSEQRDVTVEIHIVNGSMLFYWESSQKLMKTCP